MTDNEDDAQEVEDAKSEANEFLHSAIMRFLAVNKEYNPAINLIAMELALLHAAARLDLVLKETCKAESTKATFRELAGMAYKENARYRTKPRRQSKPRTKSHLSVVK